MSKREEVITVDKANTLAGKKLLLMGGVRPACEIVLEAKRMGIETHVADYLEDSPAKKYADHSHLVNVTDVDAVVALCEAEGINGVITGYVDMLLPYCEQVCRRIGKPFWGNAANIDMCINKEAFKHACEQAGVPVVPWKKANKDNYREVLRDVQPPVVFKPVDNSGSRGVFKCYDAADLLALAEKSLSFSKCGEILVEKMMDLRNEFSAYYVLNHGECLLSAMGDRYVYVVEDGIAPVAQGMLMPSRHLDEWEQTMHPRISAFFRSNGMREGYAFVQGFWDESGFYVHEIGYRLNGGFSHTIVEHFSGYNQIRELIRYSLTGEMDQEALRGNDPHFPGCGIIATISLKPGVIGRVEGLDEVRAHKGVLAAYQLHEEGENLRSKGTTAQYFAYVLCAEDTPEQLNETLEFVRSRIRVYDPDGALLNNEIVDPKNLIYSRQ